jgi:hypothetical protein
VIIYFIHSEWNHELLDKARQIWCRTLILELVAVEVTTPALFYPRVYLELVSAVEKLNFSITLNNARFRGNGNLASCILGCS